MTVDVGDARACPPFVVRAIIFAQAAIKRRLFFRRFGDPNLPEEEQPELEEIAPPHPMVKVALYFCRRARNPSWVNIERELMMVAGLICSKDSGLTLGGLQTIIESYAVAVHPDFPPIGLLREKLSKLKSAAEDELLQQMMDANKPSEARKMIDMARARWDAREGGGQDWFRSAEDKFDELSKNCEDAFRVRYERCRYGPGYAQLLRELDAEFGKVESILRVRLIEAAVFKRGLVEGDLHSRWDRPLSGPIPVLLRAARTYIEELGNFQPSVLDFCDEMRQEMARHESAAAQDLAPFEKELAWLRKELSRVPPPPGKIGEGYRRQLKEKGIEALRRLQKWRQLLGTACPGFVPRARAVLEEKGFQEFIVEDATIAAQELRSCGDIPMAGDEIPDVEELRIDAAARLYGCLEYMDPANPLADALRDEFKVALEFGKRLSLINHDPDTGLPDDGWADPEGHEKIEAAPDPPPADETADIGDALKEAAEPASSPLDPAVGTSRLLEDFENVTSRRMAAAQTTQGAPPKKQKPPPIKVKLLIRGVSLEMMKELDASQLQDQYATAIAETCGVSFDRVKVLGFQVPNEDPDAIKPLPQGTAVAGAGA
eukprot:gnl/MRDRNA2_/MRDRNA2_93469_c0_seq1.p1 gnl/MRDRNA2_/MRDRNA2_93469_c0~~gnl/MRDRNA2_/MRDRNA2_93469_c0_seq1.p1  ORF type:complete len:602 (+),score=150.57 gnl/MRDRNA2_/MRDRNA2_93469_c0_seq1:65-1870(+)